jgi:tRNA1Val (adenine37-N6)-methyltransferase
MKVGIDGVLLGAWSDVEDSKYILDIGTGTGLIALMLAQRSHSLIDAIEVDKNAVDQAIENIENSPWSNRIKVQEISLQNFAKITLQRYDLIVSNPPYFVNSLKTPSLNRTTARHTDTLTHEELILNAIALLKPTGRICIILPVKEAVLCKSFALSEKIYCTREVKVIPKPNADVKRILMEFSLQFKPVKLTELVIESNERHHYSDEFSELAKEFYLRL